MTTKDVVLKSAKLSRLEITDAEAEQYTPQLQSILDYIEQLKTVDVTGVEATSHVHDISNVYREDLCVPSLDPQEISTIAPQLSGRFFKVPLVIES